MKKFTFFLSLLLAFVGLTASAQDVRTWKKLASTPSVDNAVTDLSTLQDGGTYAFYSTSYNKYIEIDNYGNLHFGNTSTLSTDDDQAGLAVFKIHITTSGEQTVYSFETALEGYYMPAVSNNNSTGGSFAAQTTNPATFVIRTTDLDKDNPVTKTDGSFVIKNTANDYGFDMTSTQFCGWLAKGDNCWYKIVPVTLSNEEAHAYKVTYNVKEGDKVLATTNDWLKEGATATTQTYTTSYYFTTPTLTNTNTTIAADNVVFDYSVTKSASPFDTNKNYAIKINGNRYFEAATTDENGYVNTLYGNFSANTYETFCHKIWKFVESGLGVKIYNPYLQKYIKVNGGNAVTLDNEGTEMYFVQTGSNYALRTTTNKQYLNSSINFGGANNRLGTWTEDNISGGSTLALEDADNSENILTIGKTALTTTLSPTTTSNTNLLSYEVGNAYETAKAKVASATTLDELQTIYEEAINATPTTVLTVDENAFYRLKIADTYLTTDGMFVGKDGSLSTSYNNGNAYDGKNLNRNITRSTAEAAFGPQIWRFVKTSEGAYQLKNANTRCNSAFFNGNLDMPIDETYGQSISIKPVLSKDAGDNSNVSIVWSNQIIGTRSNNYYGPNNWAANEACNIWQIEKVTSVPVTITDAKYASVAYPFATQVTGDVKAYYASAAENGALTLTEYPEGIIPANEGAILFNEGGATTATLNVISTDNTVTGNLLKPATAKRAGFTAGETYVLAKNTNDEAAFLKSELTVVPANKAYIAATDLPTSSESQDALGFNFGGDVTGINAAVATDKAQTEYYDLQGRRVLYPVHGIFVTNTGKKVLVK